jgi:N-acyl-D-aspartate/D-glutamate deacylase
MEYELMTADLVIRNGTLADGTGGPLRRADVAIGGTAITEVGKTTSARGGVSSTPTACW